MTSASPLFAGLDAGSTTLKLVVLDAVNGTPLVADYRRHRADIPGTLAAMLADAEAKLGANTALSLVITGSAGLGLAESFDLPFMQESVAAAAMARHFHPEIRTLVDIGGEDAKMIFFAPGHAPDIRMNGSCAGGTGAFLDQIATLLNCEAPDLEALANAAESLHPVASRCGVFAKTDIQNLLSRNIPPADIAASAFRAVAQQIVSSLARGRDIEGPVLFCGGPLAHLAHLRKSCTEAFGVGTADCVLPANAALVPALGCAIAPGLARTTVSAGELRKWAVSRTNSNTRVAPKKKAACGCGETCAIADAPAANALAPLFSGPADYQQWRARKERRLPTAGFDSLPGDGECVLGVDSGSTTTKIVALAPNGAVLFTHYAPNNGNPLESLRAGLAKFHDAAVAAGKPALRVRHTAVTGYGEDLLKAAFGFETGLVETMAHYSAARSLDPAVSFLLDIGGQDMKAVFIENNAIVRLDINEACSSGCGSFMDTFARSLGMSAAEFAAIACEATAPCDLGTRCTVFMNSKVKQAQRENATRADIAAGLAYSVAKNCLYKVLKLKDTAVLGPRLVVQGGTMRNHAVVRALELLTGLEITVAPLPELMGAYGAALFSLNVQRSADSGQREPLHSDKDSAGVNDIKKFEAVSTASRLLSALAHPQAHQTADSVCPGCENRCLVRQHSFTNGNTFYAGNKCEKIYSNRGGAAAKGENYHAFKQRLLFSRATTVAQIPSLTIGIPRALGYYENFPFWHTLLTTAGLRVALSNPSTFKLYGHGARSIMSDNICFPAKLVHGHILNLVSKKVDRILMPFVIHEQLAGNGGGAAIGSGLTQSYNCPIVTGYSDVVRSALDTATKHNIPLDAPALTFADVALLHDACRDYLTKTLGISAAIFERAFTQALATQNEFSETLSAKAREIHDKNAGTRPLIILAGRPYHNDPLIQHKVADMFADLGADVISEDISRIAERPDAATPARSPWAFPNRILDAAAFVATAPEHVHFVQITSFGCGPDAFIIDEVGDRLRRAGKSHTVLKVDDINNPGSLRLRARSLLESVQETSVQRPASSVQRSAFSVQSSAFSVQSSAASVQRPERSTPPTTAPFTEADRERRTVLVPFFSEFYSPFIPTMMNLMGYKALALPPPDDDSIDHGLKYANNEICYPATLVIGDFIRELKSGKYNRDEIALGITQTGGQCRATSYLALIKKALLAAGYADVPVVSVGTVAGAAANDQPGFRMTWNAKKISGLAQGMIYADHIAQMYHATAPREKTPGAAARLRDSYISAGVACLARLDTAAFRPLLRQAVADFNAEVRDIALPKVGIVGEIYIKYSAVGNRNIIQWLISQGVEPIVPALADFFLQEIPNRQFNRRNNLARRDWTAWVDKAVYQLIRHWQRGYARIASKFRFFRPGEDIFTKSAAASHILSLAAQYGEGWLIAAELAAFAESGVDNAVSLQPFGCIANHLIAKGIERRIREVYPRMNLLFLDLDSGTSEANLLNRLHFIVQNAKDVEKGRKG